MNFGILISPFPGDLHLIFSPLIYKFFFFFFFFFMPPLPSRTGWRRRGGCGWWLWDHNFLAFTRFCVRSSEWFFHFDIVDDDCTFRLTNVNCFACSVMDWGQVPYLQFTHFLSQIFFFFIFYFLTLTFNFHLIYFI